MRGPSRESALLNPDFRDMLSISNEEKVEYLVVGAYALADYGNPRATKDLDLWIRCSEENAGKTVLALCRFGAPSSLIRIQDFIQPGLTVQIGIAPRQIDLVTEISGVTFEDAYPRHTKVEIEGVSVSIIGRQDLLLNKKAAGRPQDLADASWLEAGE